MFQLAMTDLCRSAGIIPDGTLGCGLGDLSAAYAGGAVSRERVLGLAGAAAANGARMTDPGVYLRLEADSSLARDVCSDAPVPLRHVGTLGPRRIVVHCDAGDESHVRAYLKERATIEDAYRMDAQLYGRNAGRVRNAIRHQAPQGADCAAASGRIYVSLTGQRLPDDVAIDGQFAASTATSPFHFDEALTCALADGFSILLVIGPGASVIDEVSAAVHAARASATVIGLEPGELEHASWQHALERLRKLGVVDRAAPANGALPRAPDPSQLAPDDPYVSQDRSQWLHELRMIGPVARLSKRNSHLALGYPEVREVLSHPDQFPISYVLNHVEPLGDGTIATAPETLKRLQRKYLHPHRMSRLGLEAERFASAIVENHPQDEDFEVVRMLSAPLSDYVAGRLVGLSKADIDHFVEATSLRTREFVLGTFDAASSALVNLPDGIPMVHEVIDSEAFTERQARSFVQGFWIAAAVSLRLALPSAVLLLLEQPDLQHQLRASHDLVPRLVDEALRLHPPSYGIPRIATMDTAVGGVPVGVGATVEARLDAANRDPQQFEAADEVRLDRSAHHLTFSHGVRRCSGATLARQTLAGGVKAVLQPTSLLRAAQPLSTIRWMRSYDLHGLEQLWVTWE